MPFTLFAPFCTPYQLAQLQQGPMPGVPSLQGLESPCLAEPTVLGTRTSGACEEAERPPLSSSQIVGSPDQHSHEPLPVKDNNESKYYLF